jgi:hypothetical protein
MEVILLVADISAMFLLVRWSAKQEAQPPKFKDPNSAQQRAQSRPERK